LKGWFLLIAVMIVLIGLVLGAIALFKKAPEEPVEEEPVVVDLGPRSAVIGQSVEGRPIEAYSYGSGDRNLLFVGGVHGGYEWNSVLLAYRMMDYLGANLSSIPEGLVVTIVPNANPDGVYKVIGKEGRFNALDVPSDEALQASGRFNANDVDINRNFDCKWQPESTWRGNVVSAGTEAFSEPEAEAIRSYVVANNPKAAIFWHSQSNAVYASECESGILPETTAIMNAYSKASGYPPVDSFDAYSVTGDAEGWLASVGIPAITVELSSHEAIEFEKNLAGVRALLSEYAK